jgi:hypothetical protein
VGFVAMAFGEVTFTGTPFTTVALGAGSLTEVVPEVPGDPQ